MSRRNAHSYRHDPAVPAFDDSQPLLVFDGECVLCSVGVQWMLARDPKGKTQFATIQSALPKALYAHYGLDAERFDTFLVLADGHAFTRWAGVLAAARTLPAPWRWLGLAGRIVPDRLGDVLYDFVQRHRLSWFGRRSLCTVPDARSLARLSPPSA